MFHCAANLHFARSGMKHKDNTLSVMMSLPALQKGCLFPGSLEAAQYEYGERIPCHEMKNEMGILKMYVVHSHITPAFMTIKVRLPSLWIKHSLSKVCAWTSINECISLGQKVFKCIHPALHCGILISRRREKCIFSLSVEQLVQETEKEQVWVDTQAHLLI